MEKRYSSSNKLVSPTTAAGSTPPRDRPEATSMTPTNTRNRLYSLNTDTLTPTLTSHLTNNTTPAIGLGQNPIPHRTSVSNDLIGTGILSTSPPNFRFHIGSAPTSSSSSPSSLVGNRLLYENRQNAMLINNFGDPSMIDDLEEETILDVYLTFFS